MPSRQVATYLFDAYATDRGAIIENVRAKSVFPPDMTQVQAGAIINDAGGTLLKFAGVEVNPDPGSICSEQSNLRPRDLTFIRKNGNSISIKVADRTALIATATAIRDRIDGVNADFPVVCIKLDGEEFLNIYDELGGSGTVTATGTPPRGTGAKQEVHHGSIPYQSDAGFGTVKIMPVKILTDVADAPPTFLGGTWDSCVGPFEQFQNCAGQEPRDHRRYILTVAATGDVGSFTSEVPVLSHTEDDILQCGQNLAGLDPVYCVGYKGENNDRLHKLL